MTTITIKNTKNLSRTNFESIEDLQEYLLEFFFSNNKEFSDKFKAELDNREKSLLAGESETTSWETIKEEMFNRVSK